MSLGRVVGFSGNLARSSRTRALVATLLAGASSRLGLDADAFELNDLGPSFSAARSIGDLDEQASAVVDAIVKSDLLVVGTPIYKGSYSGLFKHLFDLLDPQALLGKPVILTATGGSDRHALVIEHQLRPLFGFFAAHTTPTGVYATERDFQDGRVVSPNVLARIDQSLVEAERLVAGLRAGFPLLAAE